MNTNSKNLQNPSNLVYKASPWKSCLGYARCSCNKKLADRKKQNIKSNRTGLSEGKPLLYPNNVEISNRKIVKTFQIKYDGSISLIAKSILNSFRNKYIYYAIDDLIYLLNSHSKEQEKLLTVLYSTMMSVHNNFSINFFDIWIDSIYVNDICTINRFLVDDSKNFKQSTLITLKLYYIKRLPVKKNEPIW